MSNFHEPVLLKEAIAGLRAEKNKKYIDATLGGGGHTIEILRRGGIVLGLDVDREAIEYVQERIKNLNENEDDNERINKECIKQITDWDYLR